MINFLDVSLSGGGLAGIIIGCVVGGFLLGFLVMRLIVKKESARNDPYNEDVLRVMYMRMGKKPSEADLKRTIRMMKEANGEHKSRRR